MSVRNAASPRSISSQASASATKSRPAPPYSSGTTIPRIPSSAMPSISSRSSLWSMSFCDRDREDALVHEWPDGVLDQPLLVAELEVHARSLPSGSIGERGQAVDRLGVSLAHVVAHARRRPCSRATARAAGARRRTRSAARRTRTSPRCARPRTRITAADALARVGCRNDPAGAVQPDDPRRALECAEHDADPPVLTQVGSRLGAAADVVVVLERLVPSTIRSEPIGPFGETFTWPPSLGGGRDEEQALTADPLGRAWATAT